MELKLVGVDACMVGGLRELSRFSLHVVGVTDGFTGCVVMRLKILAAPPRRLEGSGHGLRQPCSHVLSDWRFRPGIEAERLGFIVQSADYGQIDAHWQTRGGGAGGHNRG